MFDIDPWASDLRYTYVSTPTMLASSSSDDDNDGNASPSSAMSQLNDQTLTIEKHKIRDALSPPSLSETSWASIVQNGFMQLSHHHRQLLRHIARYSTASKCTLYCIVGDKDVHRKQVKYFTAVVCTPLTLLQDIENGTVEVYKVLYPRTLTITVDSFLCCELARFVDEHPTPIVRRHSKRVILPLGFRYPNTDLITWKSRITHSALYVRVW